MKKWLVALLIMSVIRLLPAQSSANSGDGNNTNNSVGAADNISSVPVSTSPAPQNVGTPNSVLLGWNIEDWYVREVEVSIVGMSSEAAILRTFDCEQGIAFATLEELEEYVAEKRENLRKTGYFSRLDITLLDRYDPAEPRRLGFVVHVYAVDHVTFYPLPFPYYNSNSGFGVKGRLIWDNVFGSFTDLNVSATAIKNSSEGGRNDYSGYIRLSNIYWLSKLWQITVGGSYNADDDLDFYGDISISGIEIGPFDWRFRIRENIANFFNNGDSRYSLTTLGINTSMLLYRGAGFGSLRYGFGPDFDFYINENLDVNLAARFSHSLSVGKNEEKYDYKSSFYFSLSNNYRYFFTDAVLADAANPLLINIQPLFKISSQTGIFGFRGRALARYSWNQDDVEIFNLGSYLRGVRNDKTGLDGNWLAVMNLDMPLTFYRGDYWGEFIWEPFLDIGWMGRNDDFSLEDMQVGVGFDLSWNFRSLVIRLSLGMDQKIDNINDSKKYEISISTGTFF